MKLSLRDKKILLMFAGILIFAVSYLFVYRPQMEKAEEYSVSSEPLEERLLTLIDMAANREQYLTETEEYNQKIAEYTAQFPSEVKEEDGIVLAAEMEQALDMEFSTISLGSTEFVASLDGSVEDGTTELSDQTLSERANAQTQEQLDEIEGVSSEEETAPSETSVSSSSVAVLYRTQDTLTFQGTYEGLKNTVEYLASRNKRMTLDSVDVSYDSSTGNLAGTITVNLFSMQGTDGTYSQPEAGSTAYGTDNIFGTIETAAEESEASDTAEVSDSTDSTETYDTAEASDSTETYDSSEAAQ